MDQLPRLGKKELICLLLFTCNYMVFVRRGFVFLWVLEMGYVILLWHSLHIIISSEDCHFLKAVKISILHRRINVMYILASF